MKARIIMSLAAAAMVLPMSLPASAENAPAAPAKHKKVCRKSSGTTGLVAGGVVGAVVGGKVIGGGVAGPLLGAAGGALAGRAIDRTITAKKRCVTVRD
jgi:uncharacterized protein YcfJ